MAFGSVHFPRTPATSDHAGVMSRDDKVKLDALPSAADLAAKQRAQDTKLNALEDLCRSLEAASIARSASGNPVTIEDGADAVPVKSLKVQIAPVQAGSGDPSPDNIRPISGISSVTVTRVGKNLVGIEPFTAYWASGSSALKDAVNALPVGQYTISAKFTLADLRESAESTFRYGIALIGVTLDRTLSYWPIDAAVGDTAIYSASFEITESNRGGCTDAYFYGCGTYAAGRKGEAVVSEIQIERGTEYTSYTPYQGQSVTVSLTDGSDPLTVYGGTLNVTTGELTVTHGSNLIKNQSWTLDSLVRFRSRYPIDNMSRSGQTFTNIMCEVFTSSTAPIVDPTDGADNTIGRYSDGFIYILAREYSSESDFISAVGDYRIVYPFETPLTYQLTPQEVTTLLGVNTIAADCGAVDVTYRADAGLAIDALERHYQDAIVALGANI